MKTIFIDCNAQLGAVWQRVHCPDDPAVTINTTPFEKNELPRVIGDHDIAIDDHSTMPTDLVRQCKNLKHIARGPVVQKITHATHEKAADGPRASAGVLGPNARLLCQQRQTFTNVRRDGAGRGWPGVQPPLRRAPDLSGCSSRNPDVKPHSV